MCGISAIFSREEDIFSELFESLYHLQHRGQDSFGFSYFNEEGKIETYRKEGLVSNNSSIEISTKIGIGHVRYPTFGKNDLDECQPFYVKGKYHSISMIHNGQIETDEIENKIGKLGENCSDSLYLAHYLSYLLNQYRTLNYLRLFHVFTEIQKIKGAFNCICLIEGFGLVCFKDKFNIRPLVIGQKNDNYIICSESVSITSIDYELLGDVYGNSVITFTKEGLDIIKLTHTTTLKPCIFEWVYLAREESIINSVNVYKARIKMGELLATKIKSKIDISDLDYVIPIPDTSKPVALEIANQLKKPYVEAITKNRYVNRTFIMDTNKKRNKNIKRKLNAITHLIKHKRILIVDDSIVRGNTMRHIIKLLKDNQVRKIYIAICSPQIKNTNKFGYDMPRKEDLVSYLKTDEEIEKEWGIEKIIFQDLEDLKKSITCYNKYIKDFELSIFGE